MVKVGLLLVVLTCGAAVACGDGDATDDTGTGGAGGSGGSGGSGGGGATPIEIEGAWKSDFGSTEIIDDTSWSVDYGDGATVSEIVEFSNADNDAILLSPDDAEFDPGTYGRVVWTDVAGHGFYYCSVSYGADSAAAARSESQPFDDSDPETGGCGELDFAWTRLAGIEIVGEWTSDFGDETIDNDSWDGASPQAIVEFSNEDNYAVLQNPDDAEFNPGLFGRNVWTEIDDDTFYYCTVAYMSDSAEATADDAEPSDDADPENAGCGASDFPWTKLTRR